MKRTAKTPTVFQMEATECGAASLAMIFAYFGKYFSLEQLRIETGVSRDGCNAGNILRCAKKYGLDCHGYRKRAEELRELTPPCIIHWNNNHFVVFDGYKGKYAYINDPAIGRRKLKDEEFKKAFSGIVLTFMPTAAFVPEKRDRSLAALIKKRISGEAVSLLKIFVAGFLLLFPSVLIPLLAQQFVDHIFLGGNRELLWKILLFLLGTAALQIILILYKYHVLAKMQKRWVLLSAKDCLSRLFRLPIAFFQQRYTGELTNRVLGNTRVVAFLSEDLPETVTGMAAICIYSAVMISYSPILALAALIGLAVNVFVSAALTVRTANETIRQKQDHDNLFGMVCAGIGISETIKAAGVENTYSGKIREQYQATAAAAHKAGRVRQRTAVLIKAIDRLTVAAIVVTGGFLMIQGTMTAGMLIAFVAVYSLLAEPVRQSVAMQKAMQKTKADIGSVEDILRYRPDERFLKESKTEISDKLKGTVSLQHITFGYSRTAPPVISDISLQLGCGQSLAIVGSSGCGKSTVAKVISGLVTPWEGMLLFDGTETARIPNAVMSASVAVVSQQSAVFSGTVRDNITMWNNSIAESDLIAAAKDACIHDDITQKPGAYDYRLTEGGSNFSGGQRQRLEIARALVTNPTVLILDEATSALDPVTEKQIMYHIKRRGCTCIVIAHRLSAVRDCDEIIVMDKGKIIGRGTHETLAATDAVYQQLVNNL